MQRKLLRGLITVLGAAAGLTVIVLIFRLLEESNVFNIYQAFPSWSIIAGMAVVFFVLLLIFFAISPSIAAGFAKLTHFYVNRIRKMPMIDVIVGTAGLIVALILAFLVTTSFRGFINQWLEFVASVAIYLFFASVFWHVCVRRRVEIVAIFSRKKQDQDVLSSYAGQKVLDTNVLIDGRIFDILKTGFVEGRIIMPDFVLQELRHIADSSDQLKRTKGRRGLDILNRIQKELDIEVVIDQRTYDDIDEVDNKLLRLAQQTDSTVITNDFNLNKVAKVQNIRVLNINDLANALKPVLASGEELSLFVVKQGKEKGQGVAYLDDGTMIVIEDGGALVGEEVRISVTSVLQTSAGRMIFAKKI